MGTVALQSGSGLAAKEIQRRARLSRQLRDRLTELPRGVTQFKMRRPAEEISFIEMCWMANPFYAFWRLHGRWIVAEYNNAR